VQWNWGKTYNCWEAAEMTEKQIRAYAEKLREEAGIKKFTKKAQAAIDAVCKKDRNALLIALWEYRGTEKEALLLTFLKWRANRPRKSIFGNRSWSLGNDNRTCALCLRYRWKKHNKLPDCGRCCVTPDCYERRSPFRPTMEGRKRPLMNALRKAWRELCGKGGEE